MTSLLSKTAPNYAQKQGTGNSFHIPQPFLNYGGLTKMMSSDYKYVPKEPTYQNIPQEKPDSSKQDFSNTLFQNEPKKEGEKTSDNPQDDDTIGFWLNNINSSNMYRSFIKGKNPWAKSSAFTQKIQNTRGAYLFYQNAFDSPLGGQQGLSAEEQRRREEELRKQQEEEKKN